MHFMKPDGSLVFRTACRCSLTRETQFLQGPFYYAHTHAALFRFYYIKEHGTGIHWATQPTFPRNLTGLHNHWIYENCHQSWYLCSHCPLPILHSKSTR